MLRNYFLLWTFYILKRIYLPVITRNNGKISREFLGKKSLCCKCKYFYLRIITINSNNTRIIFSASFSASFYILGGYAFLAKFLGDFFNQKKCAVIVKFFYLHSKHYAKIRFFHIFMFLFLKKIQGCTKFWTF